jgi:hypothetical protein
MPPLIPFLAPTKPNPPRPERERRHRMTLVSALIGSDAIVMFADNEEAIGDLGKKNVDKLTVWDAPNHPFRFAIAAATNDAMYIEMLERKLASTLLALSVFSFTQIENELVDTLSEFYRQHTPSSLIELLITVQPLPSGRPQVIHIAHTAVSIPSLSERFKNIGKGAYVADIVLPNLVSGWESSMLLVLAAVYTGKVVHKSTPGVGPVERIVLLSKDGEYDELWANEIREFEENLTMFDDIVSGSFAYVALGQEPDTHKIILEDLTEELNTVKERNMELWESIQSKIRKHAERRKKMEERKRKTGSDS